MVYKTRAVISVALLVMLAGMLLVAPVHAQNSLAPDPADLARRLLDFDGQPTIPPLSPVYAVGDTAQFWASKAGQDTPVEITTKLAARGLDIYIWVEEGVQYSPAAARQLAGALGQMLATMRIVANYPQASVVPQSPGDLAVIPTYDLPDVDNDPYLYIVFTRDLVGGQNLIYNPVNSLMAELVPGGYSNQHEMIFVSTSNLPDVELNNNAYIGLLARGIYNLLAGYNNPGQAAWLSQALAWYMLLYGAEEPISAGDVQNFFAAPEISLLGTTGQEFGEQQLFLHYLDQRFGRNILSSLATGSGPGLAALDTALRDNRITDPVSGEPMTGASVFADFVMANILNGAFGDGRYVHIVPAAQGLNARFSGGQDTFDFDLTNQAINQFGTRYLVLSATRPADFILFFTGEDTVARLPMPGGDADNRFYWSGDVPNRDAKMTRTVDLSGVESATLTFDAWYNLLEGRHYAYVQVSTDGGATWDILPASDTVSSNPYALNYGTGFTGISSADSPRPFPYLGAVFEADGVTINAVSEGGPLANTDAQAGDVIAGYDGEPWGGQPDIVGLLNGYEPGDTLDLLIERDGDTFDLPVLLGVHPTRMRIPDAVWLSQTVDLSDYVGQTIQLRFESVSFPGQADLGMVIDNIAIPQIEFLDDAESGVPGWTLEGWQQTSNQLDQRFLIQSALLTEDNVHVRPLIGVGDRATEGAWEFSLEAGETLIVAISGVNDNTSVPAGYSLRARQQGSDS